MKGDYYWSLLTKHGTKIVKTCRGKLSKEKVFERKCAGFNFLLK
jgi:hypothetical protein